MSHPVTEGYYRLLQQPADLSWLLDLKRETRVGQEKVHQNWTELRGKLGNYMK